MDKKDPNPQLPRRKLFAPTVGEQPSVTKKVADKVADRLKVADKVADVEASKAQTKFQRYRQKDTERKREVDRLRKAAARARKVK